MRKAVTEGIKVDGIWVQKAQAANYLGGFITITWGKARHSKMQFWTKPLQTNGVSTSCLANLSCPSLGEETGWLAYSRHRYISLGFISHLTQFLTIHPEHGITVQELQCSSGTLDCKPVMRAERRTGKQTELRGHPCRHCRHLLCG